MVRTKHVLFTREAFLESYHLGPLHVGEVSAHHQLPRALQDWLERVRDTDRGILKLPENIISIFMFLGDGYFRVQMDTRTNFALICCRPKCSSSWHYDQNPFIQRVPSDIPFFIYCYFGFRRSQSSVQTL